MELHVKNQLWQTVEFCCGTKEYELGPEEEITIEVEDGDYMYIDCVKK